MERAFDFEGVPYVKMVTPRHFYEREIKTPTPADIPLTPISAEHGYLDYAATTIVKFHGDFTDPDESSFRKVSYFDRMAFEDPLDVFLRSEILGRSVLFIGYSFSDRNIRFIWHRLRRMMKRVPDRARRPSYLVTSSASAVQQEILRQMDVHVILVDPANVRDGISEILEQTIVWQEA